MKKLLLLLVLIASSISCNNAVIELQAQTLPYNLKAGWDNNPITDNVTGYDIYVDGTKVISTDTTVCNSSGCTQIIPITTAGAHIISISAVNQYGEGLITGCASCAFSINLAVPTAVKNFKIVP